MAATQPPDASTLANWEDAFLYPLPTVLRLEQQLRQNISANREKLRSLVGDSYRDLLGTAEKIVEMDEQMNTVETGLSDISKRCNARVLERITANESRMRAARDEHASGRYAGMAQMKVLQGALGFVGRVVRDGGDALQAAKVLVLARLLHKSASEATPTMSMMESSRKKLAGLRKKLLVYIERVLIRPAVDVALLAHTLAAYALVTSSTPKDVLRHFLQVRFGQLEASTEATSEVEILQMLDMYSRTLLDTRDLFPRRFADVLSSLAKIPLLQDEQVRTVLELNLDIYGSWIADNIRAFTPWVRHEQLSTSDVAEALASWTRQAQECVVQGIEVCLQEQHGVGSILEIRRKVLSKHLSLNSRVRSEIHSQAVQRLRRTFLQRLEQLATDLEQSLDISLDAKAGDTYPAQNLWSTATSALNFSHGAAHLRKNVLHMRHARSTDTDREAQKLDSFLERLNTFWATVDTMRYTKWDDELDFELDDLDGSDALQAALTKEDPQQVHQTLQRTARDGLKRVYERIKTASDDEKARAMFLIRVLRETDRCARSLDDRLPVPLSDLRSDGVAESLQRRIAMEVSRPALDTFTIEFKRGVFAAVSLWDETTPRLPVQPSPTTFKFLMGLHRSMADAGNDLWSPACIAQVKACVHEQLERELASYEFDTDDTSKEMGSINAINGHHDSGENEEQKHTAEEGKETDEKGESKVETSEKNKLDADADSKAETESRKNERHLQRLFDALYMQQMLSSTRMPKEVALRSLVTSLRELAKLEGGMIERLQKSTHEYWNRTHLLFGLLASDR